MKNYSALKLKLAMLLVLIGIMLNLSSCSVQEYSSQLYAMNTVVEVKFYGSDETQIVSGELNRIEKLLSVTNENSDISKLNYAQGESVAVSDDTVKVLETAFEIYADSHGDFDPSIYPVVKLWGFTTDNYNVPDNAQITSALKNVDFSKIEISDNSVRIPAETEIDLGGIAKGYAGQCIRDVLKDSGITSAIISIGGNVQTVGNKPDGSNWTIGLKNPDGGEKLCDIKVGECSVVTSGGYERYFEMDGKTYHHIIDPDTGRPAESDFKSVTVICDDGARADGLSTALYVGGFDLVKEYISSHSDVEVIAYTVDDKLAVTQGIYDKITLCFAETIEIIG